jgi:hypothetical protein
MIFRHAASRGVVEPSRDAKLTGVAAVNGLRDQRLEFVE